MQFKKGASLVSLMVLIHAHLAATNTVTPYFSIRSQSANAARRISGLTNQLYQPSNDQVVYGTLSLTPEYTRSYNNDRITECLFGSSVLCSPCKSSIRISGSRSPDRGPQDWLADYFYLPTDFVSNVHFEPIIDNFIIDFEYYIQLDAWIKGLYFQLSAPLVHSRWSLRMHETIKKCGTDLDDYGYFTPQQLTTFLEDFTQYANGASIDPIIQNLSSDPNVSDPFTVVAQPLMRAQMSCERLIRTRLADLRMFFGWNHIWCPNKGHIGLDIQVAAPSGNTPAAHYLFEPIVGNGGHWELGGGIHGNVRFAEKPERNRFFNFYAEANITHLFKTKQHRTFDLCGKPMSRYMLAERMQSTIQDGLVGVDGATDIIPNAQFASEFAPVANISTVRVAVSAAAQIDALALFNYTCGGFTWDLGYNLWFISCEQIGCPENLNLCDNWALKGDAAVFGYESNQLGSQDLLINSPVALSASQSGATINFGLNFPATGAVTPVEIEEGRRNPNIDNPLPASAQTELTAQPGTDPSVDRINTSINPVFITLKSLSTQSGRNKGFSSKLFTHLGYAWCAGNGWVPYVGIGAEAEWGHQSNPIFGNKSDSCIGTAISQWGIWIKGGVTFN
jgi:hypothetical protein